MSRVLNQKYYSSKSNVFKLSYWNMTTESKQRFNCAAKCSYSSTSDELLWHLLKCQHFKKKKNSMEKTGTKLQPNSTLCLFLSKPEISCTLLSKNRLLCCAELHGCRCTPSTLHSNTSRDLSVWKHHSPTMSDTGNVSRKIHSNKSVAINQVQRKAF